MLMAMTKDLIATSAITIDAPRWEVWKALTDSVAAKQYMFGADVRSDWKVGSPITWSGEWQGKPYKDKGEVLQADPGRLLQFSHFSPQSGRPDRPEDHHIVTIELGDAGPETEVTLKQNNNETEEARRHSEQNWNAMLQSLKKFIEAKK
jgi:uncharacterized protein YndB with AHSA1/START domain